MAADPAKSPHGLADAIAPGKLHGIDADAIAPGELHRIDMKESQIDLARDAARAGGHDKMSFHVGNVYDLPFEDDTFDLAHSLSVLRHILDTQAALAEGKRALKPGGIIVSRKTIVAPSFLEPQPPEITDALGVFANSRCEVHRHLHHGVFRLFRIHQ